MNRKQAVGNIALLTAGFGGLLKVAPAMSKSAGSSAQRAILSEADRFLKGEFPITGYPPSVFLKENLKGSPITELYENAAINAPQQSLNINPLKQFSTVPVLLSITPRYFHAPTSMFAGKDKRSVKIQIRVSQNSKLVDLQQAKVTDLKLPLSWDYQAFASMQDCNGQDCTFTDTPLDGQLSNPLDAIPLPNGVASLQCRLTCTISREPYFLKNLRKDLNFIENIQNIATSAALYGFNFAIPAASAAAISFVDSTLSTIESKYKLEDREIFTFDHKIDISTSDTASILGLNSINGSPYTLKLDSSSTQLVVLIPSVVADMFAATVYAKGITVGPSYKLSPLPGSKLKQEDLDKFPYILLEASTVANPPDPTEKPTAAPIASAVPTPSPTTAPTVSPSVH